MKNKCYDCDYWVGEYPTFDIGECRRNAPTRYNIVPKFEDMILLNSRQFTFWPITSASDYCGDFKMKESK